MIIIGWWNMGGEGNGAKREQYLDWWNKNWLETRLSGNPPIFFIYYSSGFLFAIPLTAHTSYYSVFSPSVICDTKLFNIHFDDLFRWTPFLILLLINIMSTNIIGQLKEYFSTCAEMRKTVIVVIFIVLFFPPYCANFSTHCGRIGLFTLISVIFADLLGISMLIFCISARLLCQFFEAEITPVLIPNAFCMSECVLYIHKMTNNIFGA